jgi:hypothetical protein
MNKFSLKAAFFAIGMVALLGLCSYGDVHADGTSKDPLFSRMEGHWTGTGTVTYSISGRQESLQVDVNSVVSIVDGQERLTSTSQVTQTQAGAPSKVYQTSYWITPSPTPGTYNLGYGASAQVTSTGTLDAHLTFETDQSFGADDSAYVVHSSTQFESDGSSIYTQFATQGQSVLSRTVIHYQH